MKRIKAISIALTLVILVQLLSLISSADIHKEDIVENNNVKTVQASKESRLSAEVTNDELYEAYKTFNEFTEENNLPVVFDYESFKEEYFTL